MRIIKHLSPCEILVEESFSPEELGQIEKKILQAKSKKINIPGFRPGSAPLDKIREKLVNTAEWEEGISLALQEKFLADWDKNQRKELGEIVKIKKIDTVSPNPLTLSMNCECFPPVKIDFTDSAYKKIEAGKGNGINEMRVTDKEMNSGLEELRNKRAVLQPSPEPMGKGKHAFLEISLADQNGKDLFQWGVKQYGEEFDKAVQGMKEGDEKNILFKPQEGAERIKNVLKADKELKPEKKIELKVKAEKIFNLETPELNNEFAKSLGNFKNLEELKNKLGKGILLEKLHKEREKRREDFVKSLLQKFKAEVPASLVKRNAYEAQKRFESQMAEKLQISTKELVKKRPEEEQQKIEKIFLEKSENELKLQRIIETIAFKEKIVPSDKEAEKEIKRILHTFPSPKEAEEALGGVDNLYSRVTLSLCYDKTLRFLEKENAVTEDIDKEIERIEKER